MRVGIVREGREGTGNQTLAVPHCPHCTSGWLAGAMSAGGQVVPSSRLPSDSSPRRKSPGTRCKRYTHLIIWRSAARAQTSDPELVCSSPGYSVLTAGKSLNLPIPSFCLNRANNSTSYFRELLKVLNEIMYVKYLQQCLAYSEPSINFSTVWCEGVLWHKGCRR